MRLSKISNEKKIIIFLVTSSIIVIFFSPLNLLLLLEITGGDVINCLHGGSCTKTNPDGSTESISDVINKAGGGKTTSPQVVTQAVQSQAVQSQAVQSEIYKSQFLQFPINPPFSERSNTFTFTLSDEGRNWKDGEEHSYRVVITDVNALIDSDNDHKVFSWNGEHIAYELKVKVDEEKKVILDSATNKAINIFKSDDTLSVCSQNVMGQVISGTYYQNHRQYYQYNPQVFSYSSPSVKIIYPDGKLIADVSAPTYDYFEVGSKCNQFKSIPRGTDIIFQVDSKDYPVKTPPTQKNYQISTTSSGTGSNFGYP